MADRPRVLDRRAQAAESDAAVRATEIANDGDAAQRELIRIALRQWYARGLQDAIDLIQRER